MTLATIRKTLLFLTGIILMAMILGCHSVRPRPTGPAVLVTASERDSLVRRIKDLEGAVREIQIAAARLNMRAMYSEGRWSQLRASCVDTASY
jgi:hypothetical protein